MVRNRILVVKEPVVIQVSIRPVKHYKSHLVYERTSTWVENMKLALKTIKLIAHMYRKTAKY